MKAIILARVSGEKQDYTQQVEDLKEMAIKDGYTDIITIENKESAIKNDEEHRLGLTELKERITSDPDINAVYVRELSRIGRREEVNLSIKNFLIEHKVQLVIQIPSIRLFDEDGKVNSAAELVFSLFNTMAKQEMETKQVRFQQGKKLSVAKGKTASGKPIYGYSKDADGYITVDPKRSEIVKEVFRMCATGNYSLRSIYQHFKLQGKITKTFNYISGETNMIRLIITNPIYKGEQPTDRVYQHQYPQLVSAELWQQANDVIANNEKPKLNTKYTLYGKGLVRCSCGHAMRPIVASKCAYVCEKCGCNVNVNYIEYAVKEFTTDLKLKQQTINSDAESNRILVEQAEIRRKLLNIPNLIEDLETQKDRAYTAFVKGKVSEKMYDSTTDGLNTEIRKLQHLEAELTEKLDIYQAAINSMDSRTSVIDVVEDATDKDIQMYAREVIKAVNVDCTDKNCYHITVEPLIPVKIPYKFTYDRSKLPFIRLYLNGKDVTKHVPIKYKRVRK